MAQCITKRNKRLEEKVPKRMPMEELCKEQVSQLVLTGSLVASSICGRQGHIDVCDAAIALSRSNSSTSIEGAPPWVLGFSFFVNFSAVCFVTKTREEGAPANH